MENHELFLSLIDLLKTTKNSQLIWKAEEIIDRMLMTEVQAIRDEKAKEAKPSTGYKAGTPTPGYLAEQELEQTKAEYAKGQV